MSLVSDERNFVKVLCSDDTRIHELTDIHCRPSDVRLRSALFFIYFLFVLLGKRQMS